MADHSKPVLAGTSYTDFRDQLMARIDDALRSLDPAVTSPTNIPTGSVRWSSAAKKWQLWNGSAWVDLESEYAINIGGSAVKLKTKRKIALSGGATGTATEFDGSADITIPVTALDASKLDGDIAWARVSANAPATATRWPAFGEVTGRPAAYPPDVSLLGEAALVSLADLQWLGTPVGEYIAPLAPPPKSDPRFRYILYTAGQTGPGGYNEGVLSDEVVSGSSPNINATAKITLAGSDMNGATIRLVNTTREFFRPGTPLDVGQSSQNQQHLHVLDAGRYYGSGTSGNVGWSADPTYLSTSGLPSRSEGGDEARPRNIPITYYRRIK